MQESIIWLFIILGALSMLAIIIVRLALWINEFGSELRYVSTEIKRSHGNERKYWKKARRELWLSAFFPRH